jgi:hypothetical protein
MKEERGTEGVGEQRTRNLLFNIPSRSEGYAYLANDDEKPAFYLESRPRSHGKTVGNESSL